MNSHEMASGPPAATPGAAGATPVSPAPRRIAIVDGGSFVLPYVFGLIEALRRRGHRVDFYGSRTRYNAEFLDALLTTDGVEVIDAAISGSVASRWRGALAYAGLLWTLCRRRAEYDTVNFQFSILWPLERPVWWLLRRQLVLTVHNAVPHGSSRRQHRPVAWAARHARGLIFPSDATRDAFCERYGAVAAARSAVVPHGLLPLAPHEPVTRYRLPAPPQTLVYWSTVKPYKGVEIFTELAASESVRALGLQLEVHGRWEAELRTVRDQLIAEGVVVDDRYLDTGALRRLFAREVVFILPYRAASQSGALYTLLHHGCYFICSDVGDLGDFMRRFGLEALLLRDRSVSAVLEAIERLRTDGPALQHAFAEAQRRCGWDRALAPAWRLY